MEKLTFILVISLFGLSFGNREVPYEQVASDYFFEHLFNNEYPYIKTIEFNERTDTTGYYGMVYQCSNYNESLKKQIANIQSKEITKIDVSTFNVKIKREKWRSKRLKLKVSPALSVENRNFVIISIYKRWHFVNNYLFELNKEGQVVDICNTSEII